MATLHAPLPVELDLSSKINLNGANMVPGLEFADDGISLENLPEDANFYQSDKESESQSESQQKRSLLGRIGRSLWGKSKSEKSNDKEAVAAVLACRSPAASVNGGIAIQDPNHAKLCRSVLTLMIRQMGKNLLKGANVMNVSFPIQCCQPVTILEVAALQAGYSPPPFSSNNVFSSLKPFFEITMLFVICILVVLKSSCVLQLLSSVPPSSSCGRRPR
jgi:hypothetical protein